jgi:lipoprotein-releasing system permease protein
MGFEKRLAFRYLRSKRRYRFVSAITLLAGMGVAVGVMAMLVTLGVMDGFEEDLKNKLLGNMAPITLTARDLDREDVETVRKQLSGLPEIRGLSPYVRTQVLLAASDRPFGATLVGMDPEEIPLVSRLPEQIRVGSLGSLERFASAEGEPMPECDRKPSILVGQELANHLAAFLGDAIRLVSPVGIETPLGIVPVQKRYCVGGIFQTGLYEYDASYVYMSLAEAQRFLHLGSGVTGIEVGVGDFDRAREVADRIRERIDPSFRVEDWMQKNRRLLSAMRLEKLTAFGVLTLIVLVAVLSILSSLAMTVIEKKQEIAILKALGSTRGSILWLFILQGGVIGLAGTVTGALAGISLCRILATYPVLTLPQDVFYQLTLPVELGVMDVFSVCFATLVLSLLATLYPAWKAAGVPPAEALRYS